jgi:hypothetical protein
VGVTLRYVKSKGAYYLFIRHRNKRKAKKIGTDKTFAQRIKKEVEDRLARADLHLDPAAVTTPPTVQAYAAKYLATAAHSLKRSTVRFYRDCIENHIVPALGSDSISQLARSHVKTLIETLQGGPQREDNGRRRAHTEHYRLRSG